MWDRNKLKKKEYDMELKEAFDLIDATWGMFSFFFAEITMHNDEKRLFLTTPVSDNEKGLYGFDDVEGELDGRPYFVIKESGAYYMATI